MYYSIIYTARKSIEVTNVSLILRGLKRVTYFSLPSFTQRISMPLYYKFLGSSWGGVPRNITSSFGGFFWGGLFVYLLVVFYFRSCLTEKARTVALVWEVWIYRGKKSQLSDRGREWNPEQPEEWVNGRRQPGHIWVCRLLCGKLCIWLSTVFQEELRLWEKRKEGDCTSAAIAGQGFWEQTSLLSLGANLTLRRWGLALHIWIVMKNRAPNGPEDEEPFPNFLEPH